MCPLHRESRRRHETGSGKRGEERQRGGRAKRAHGESSVPPRGLEYPQEGESSFPKWFYESRPVYDFLAGVKSASLARTCAAYLVRAHGRGCISRCAESIDPIG